MARWKQNEGGEKGWVIAVKSEKIGSRREGWGSWREREWRWVPRRKGEAVCNPIISAVYQRSGGAPGGAGGEGEDEDDSHDEL